MCSAGELGLYLHGKEKHLKDLEEVFMTNFACVEDEVERNETRITETLNLQMKMGMCLFINFGFF